MPSNRREFLRRAAVAALAAPAVAATAPDRPFRAAVIGHTGHGDYGHGLEGIFHNRKGVELVALADPDPEGRARMLKKTGAPRGYADYREMLAEERPHLVSIAMRHSVRHHEIGMACLRANAHIYCEKPFTRTPAEADELLEEARKRKLKIAVAHTMRMMPQVTRLKQAISEDLLGEVREVRAYGKQDPRAGGEDMMVLGSHLFDLMRMFLGDPEWVSGHVTWKGRPVQQGDRRLVRDDVGWVAGDEVFAHFGFPTGVDATFTSDGRLRETIGHWGLELHGSKGSARINCDIAPNVFVRETTGWSVQGRTDAWRPLDPALVSQVPEHNLGPVGDWLEAVVRDREPECSGLNGAWAVEMVMGVYASALKGTRMKFPLPQRDHPLAA